jgi:hypothetical protein
MRMNINRHWEEDERMYSFGVKTSRKGPLGRP